MNDRGSRAETFEHRFRELFQGRFAGLQRYLAGLTGDTMLADDVAQESFMKLYLRGAMPDNPAGWLAAVANNLVRDGYRRTSRHLRLLAVEHHPADEFTAPDAGADVQVLRAEQVNQVRAALDRLAVRDRQMLLLRHEGYSYREISLALDLNAASIGTLLVRATNAFVSAYRGAPHASD